MPLCRARSFCAEIANVVNYWVVPTRANIHLIVGEDDFLVEAAARKILEAAVEPSLRATAIETVNGAAENQEAQLASLASCRASLDTPPFLDPVKATWWRGVSFLPSGKKGVPSESVKKALEKFAASLAEHPLPENQTFILSAPALLKTSIFAKTLRTCAQVVEFAGGGRNRDRVEAALSRLDDLAAAEKLTFEPGVDQAFVSRAGTDTRTLVSELAKMSTYLGDERRTVTAADVAAITSVGGDEPELWDVTDALAARSPARVLRTLARFDGDSGAAIMLSTVTEKFFRELLVYRDALDNGWLTAYGAWAKNLPADVAADLDATGLGPGTATKPWAVKNGARNAKSFSLNELRVARYRMLNVRERLVSTDSGKGLELVAQELLRIAARPAARR